MALFQFFNSDVPVPYIISMVLDGDVAFMILATTVVQQFECKRPSLLREF